MSWWPHTEPHLHAFYDEPEWMNGDRTAFDLRALDVIFSGLTPEFIGFAEDMSYNPRLFREYRERATAPA